MTRHIKDTITGKISNATNADAVPWSGVTGKPSTYAPSSHNHNDIYYTETEMDSKLSGKANSSHTHTKSQITDFPSSLKNPSALTISLNGTSQGGYDGSAAKSINVTASSVGAASSGHNHDSTYLKLSGGAMSGKITRSGGGSNISDRDNVAVSGLSYGQSSGNSYNPVVGQKTTSGYWSIGNLSGDEKLQFHYTKDSDYSAGTNTCTSVYLPNTSGTIALTSQIPSVGDGTITITQGGTSKGTFTTNQSGNTTIALTDDNTWQANTVSQNGYVTAPTTSNANKVWKTDANGVPGWRADADTNTWRGVQNNLTSTATDQSLSAYQGKVLNDKFASYVPTSRTVNGKALSANISLSASDVGAASSSHTHNYAASSSAGGNANWANGATYAHSAYNDKPIVTNGTGAAYTATVNNLTLVAGASFIMVPHTVSTTDTPTLNVNELGAKIIRMRISSSTSATIVLSSASFLAANKPIRVIYDGTYWVVDDIVRPDANWLYGAVPISAGGTGATTAAQALTNLGVNTAIQSAINSAIDSSWAGAY